MPVEDILVQALIFRILGVLGELNLAKLSQALCSWWLWFEWGAPSLLQLGLGNLCDEAAKDFFYASPFAIGSRFFLGVPVGPWSKAKRHCPAHFRGLQEEKLEGQGGLTGGHLY